MGGGDGDETNSSLTNLDSEARRGEGGGPGGGGGGRGGGEKQEQNIESIESEDVILHSITPLLLFDAIV